VLGRNGAGKSTLLATLAAFRRPTSGTVRLDGKDPFEHARLMAETCLVRQDKGFDPSMTVCEAFEVVAAFRPRWDGPYGDRLLDRFEVSPTTKLRALSTGKRAAVAVSIGLASRAPLTIFDEPQLGMDAPSRYAFYEELLADYTENPRTILVSTHLIDEIATLLEDVVILHEGRLLMHSTAEDLRGIGAELTGPAGAIDAITAGFEVHGERTLGGVKSVVVFDTLSRTSSST
jgi:ABC-2 type transport system ATP-binding protein